MEAEEVNRAAERIADGVIRTPLVRSETLSRIVGCNVLLKLEIFQFTASYKERGALNHLLSRENCDSHGGVIAVSAGNHAQALAFHASRLGIHTTVVMPEGTPFTKVARTQSHGARVILAGSTLDEAMAVGHELAESDGLHLVHPYDDESVIAGQGTVGREILADADDLDVILVPTGGGGLLAGTALAATLDDRIIEVIGIQSEIYPALVPGSSAVAGHGPTVAEGIAVRAPGVIPRSVIRRLGAEVISVTERSIEMAIQSFVEVEKIVVEGAGAVGLAALLEDPQRWQHETVALIVSGGNIDSRLLADVLVRGLVSDGRVLRLRTHLKDEPGELGRLTTAIGELGVNILELHHGRLTAGLSIKEVEVELIIETRTEAASASVVADLGSRGFEAKLIGFGAATGPSDLLK